jgi:hypothetical protein
MVEYANCIPVHSKLVHPLAPAIPPSLRGLIMPEAAYRAVGRASLDVTAMYGPYHIGPNCWLVVMLSGGRGMPYVAYGGTSPFDPEWAGPLAVQCPELPGAIAALVLGAAYSHAKQLLELKLQAYAPKRSAVRITLQLPGRSYIQTGSARAVVWPFWASLLAIRTACLPPRMVLQEFERAEQTMVGAINAQATVAQACAMYHKLAAANVTPAECTISGLETGGDTEDLCGWLDGIADSCKPVPLRALSV